MVCTHPVRHCRSSHQGISTTVEITKSQMLEPCKRRIVILVCREMVINGRNGGQGENSPSRSHQPCSWTNRVGYPRRGNDQGPEGNRISHPRDGRLERSLTLPRVYASMFWSSNLVEVANAINPWPLGSFKLKSRWVVSAVPNNQQARLTEEVGNPKPLRQGLQNADHGGPVHARSIRWLWFSPRPRGEHLAVSVVFT